MKIRGFSNTILFDDEMDGDDQDVSESTLYAGSPTCKWKKSSEYIWWDTECGDTWILDGMTPKEHGMNFCPICGKPLKL